MGGEDGRAKRLGSDAPHLLMSVETTLMAICTFILQLRDESCEAIRLRNTSLKHQPIPRPMNANPNKENAKENILSTFVNVRRFEVTTICRSISCTCGCLKRQGHSDLYQENVVAAVCLLEEVSNFPNHLPNLVGSLDDPSSINSPMLDGHKAWRSTTSCECQFAEDLRETNCYQCQQGLPKKSTGGREVVAG